MDFTGKLIHIGAIEEFRRFSEIKLRTTKRKEKAHETASIEGPPNQ